MLRKPFPVTYYKVAVHCTFQGCSICEIELQIDNLHVERLIALQKYVCMPASKRQQMPLKTLQYLSRIEAPGRKASSTM